MKPSDTISKTVPQLLRDCFRLVNHIAGNSAKGRNIRKVCIFIIYSNLNYSKNYLKVIRNEFRQNDSVKDVQQIETLKSNAIRGLANYLMLESISKDEKMKSRANNYNKSELDSLNKPGKDGPS